uniref:Excalibur calcium-binding domain-containing protein n=1 Tax=Streptomyces sp. NBC_00003 TaxID=2903608 RepID=A0AAU2VBT0_9ACTN
MSFAQWSQQHPDAPAPSSGRWYTRPVVVILGLLLFPPFGIFAAFKSNWSPRAKWIASAASAIWFFALPAMTGNDTGSTGSAAAASRSASPSPAPSNKAVAPAPSPSPSPQAPNAIGETYHHIEEQVHRLVGIGVKAHSAYDDVALPAHYTDWKVCFQSPDAGTNLVSGSGQITTYLVAPGTSCPARLHSNLHPDPTPSTPEPDRRGTGDSSASGGGGESAYYPSCSAARAAGAAPIHRGQPGYRAGLDRDGDGIACDR